MARGGEVDGGVMEATGVVEAVTAKPKVVTALRVYRTGSRAHLRPGVSGRMSGCRVVARRSSGSGEAEKREAGLWHENP